MEAILPFKIKNEPMFYESALKVGYNEMEILKFIYVMQHSDLDIFPKMLDERINVLLYGWELCEDYKQKLNPNEWELPEEMEIVLKLLVPWTLDIWFSKEWDKCKYHLKNALLHCLNRGRDLLMRLPDMMQINWDFLLLYNLKPWNVLYLKNLTVSKEITLQKGAQSIETEEMPATDEDISYVKLEQLPIIVLRLVKIFDQSSIDMVKTLCMRVIAAWNKIHQTELETSGSRRPYIPPEDKKCLMLICHIYLMAVYESDDVKGYVIDNMINNIRFYYQGFQNSGHLHAMDNLEYTPARYIALTNIRLRVQKRDFFDFFIWNRYDTSLVNLFGVVSQAYKSYLLGNILMELNNMNEDDFASNIPLYKRLMNSYVTEREKSELFLMNELNKVEAQRYAHNIIQTVQNVTDFKSKICKGNRMSNIGNYENSDDTVTPLADIKAENVNTEIHDVEIKNDFVEEIEDEEERVRVKENELRMDPIFQNLPNNESMLYYVYEVLAKREYKGWHFAKVVLLVKIISREQNMIETWRYHPGLTTDFMLNLEEQLSNHYVDLAKIFKDYPFLEQEFWLTAFYLNPTPELYEIIKRQGMRNNRKRTDEHTKHPKCVDNLDAKYGLLSSTIDVKELATISNTDDPNRDYDPLFSALHSLRVPDSLVKDMLTAIFLPRNRSFAWAVDWVILRNRCKMIMNSSKEKKRFVDLNMAEANERLKYLIIDYEKYKNRPQLDYGTIEEGYENLMVVGEFDKDSEEEEEEEDDFEDDEDVYESKKRGRGRPPATGQKKEVEKVEDDNSQEDDPFLMGKRRTRARTAATLASFLFQTLPRSSRRKRNQKSTEDETKFEEEKISAENGDKSSDSKSPIPTTESPIPSPTTVAVCEQKDTEIANVSTKHLKECLKERPTFLNTTQGFQNLVDIWNVEKSDLQTIDENCVSLLESSSALQIAVQLKLLNKEINPLGCDENEFINDKEMIIHNAEFVMKKEVDFVAINEEVITAAMEEVISSEQTSMAMPMEIDDIEEMVENYRIEVPEINANVGQVKEDNFKDSEKELAEKVTGIATVVTDLNQELLQIEENSNESMNTDLSTAARKDSGEVSESNTAITSKRSSVNIDYVNIDIEMEDKTLQNDGLEKPNETANEPIESFETELMNEEIADDEQQGGLKINKNMESVQISMIVEDALEKENKVDEENKNHNENKETKAEDEAHQKCISEEGNKTEKESTEERESKAVGKVKLNEESKLEDEIKTVQENKTQEQDKAEGKYKAVEESKSKKESKAEEKTVEEYKSEERNEKEEEYKVEEENKAMRENNKNIKDICKEIEIQEQNKEKKEDVAEKGNKAEKEYETHESFKAMEENKVEEDNIEEEYNKTKDENREAIDLKPKEVIKTQMENMEEEVNKAEEESKSKKEGISGKVSKSVELNKVEEEKKELNIVEQKEKFGNSKKFGISNAIKATEIPVDTENKKDAETEALHLENSEVNKSQREITDQTSKVELPVVLNIVPIDSEKSLNIDKAANYAEEKCQDITTNLSEINKYIEEANNPKEILTSKSDAFLEQLKKFDAKSIESFNNTDSESSSGVLKMENIENNANYLLNTANEASSKSLVNDTNPKAISEEIFAIAEDIIQINSSQELDISAASINQNQDEHKRITSKETDDQKNLVQPENNESNIALHYSSHEELNDKNKLAPQKELGAIEYKNEIDFATDPEKVEIADVSESVDASKQDVSVSNRISDQVESDAIACTNATDCTTDQEKLEITDCQKSIDVLIEKITETNEISDQTKLKTVECKNSTDASSAEQSETNEISDTTKHGKNECKFEADFTPDLENVETKDSQKSSDRSSEELNETNKTSDALKVEEIECENAIEQVKKETTDCEKSTNTSTYPTDFETDNYKELIDPSSDQINLEATEDNKETFAITYQEKLLITDCQNSADAIIFPEKLERTDIMTFLETLSNQTKLESINSNEDSRSPNFLLDDINEDSRKTPDSQVSTDSVTEYLKNLCLTSDVKVLVHKLRPADLQILRQPRIKIPRLDYEKYMMQPRAKRRRIEGTVYLEFDDSSNSINSFGTTTSSSEVYHPTKLKRKTPIRRQCLRQTRTSESDNDSNNSDDCKLSTILLKSRKRRLSTSSTSQNSNSQHVTGPKSARKSGPKSARKSGPKSARKAGPKSVRKSGPKSARQTSGPKSFKQNLVVTPRSASGLKLRISNAEQTRQEKATTSRRSREVVYDEIIQLTSSSDECPLNELSVIAEEVIIVEENPLYEEEIVI